ncbi:MAG: ester cyclase [Ignavibacterium sp.]|nr:MAG: ester cyclase [Ignavibacterium sp.]
MDELLTDDFTRHCQATPDVQVNSREEFKKLQESLLISIPDQHITIEMLIAEGDKVAGYAT